MKYLLLLAPLFICINGFSQRLDLFLSKTYVAENMGIAEPLPYTKTTSFFDYISVEQSPDTTIDDRSFYFIYFRLPGDVSELGIRLISPVPENHFAHTGDIETQSYTNMMETEKQFYFDPFLKLESGRIHSDGRFVGDSLMGENDNSEEVISKSNSKKHNSVLQITDKGIKSGIYRVLIATSEKLKSPEGNYLLQIGCVPGKKGIKVSRKLEELLN